MLMCCPFYNRSLGRRLLEFSDMNVFRLNFPGFQNAKQVKILGGKKRVAEPTTNIYLKPYLLSTSGYSVVGTRVATPTLDRAIVPELVKWTWNEISGIVSGIVVVNILSTQRRNASIFYY